MLESRVLIEPLPSPPVGLILIPFNTEKVRGKVIEVGPWVEEISPGDVVVFPKNSGQDLHYEGKEYMVLDEYEILAKECI